MTVTLQGRVCRVAPYPISIEWPPRWLHALPEVGACRAGGARALRIGPEVVIGLGVERWDFTKGIVERFQALETLLEGIRGTAGASLPAGRIALPQPAAGLSGPAGTDLSEVERINAKFAEGMAPDRADRRASGAAQRLRAYRAADFCLVNSLHDGMNLVAKEFVASREDGQRLHPTTCPACAPLSVPQQALPHRPLSQVC